MKRLATIFLAVVTGLASFTPTFAENSRDPSSAQSRGSFGDSGVNNHRSRCDIYRCGGYRNGNRYYRDRYYGDRYYGDRYYGRRYYRDHDNGAGALIGGLAAGAIIGGIIASQQPRVRATGSHADWCYSRYRSYRAYDNTYQPYYGPRRQCISP